jgi:prephenate dehydrogenase
MKFQKLGVIGLGLIGGSIAKALKDRGYYVPTVKSKSPNFGRAKKIIDQVFPNQKSLLKKSTLSF